MTLENIMFCRDNSQESGKISELLTKNKIKFTEIYLNSGPSYLIVPNNIHPIKGYKTILNNLESLKTSQSK